MSIIFLNAALAGFLAFIVVPPLVHLFARSRPPEYRFSSNIFIQRVVRQTMRIRKPREWALLLLRTLMFAALILVFLRPFYYPVKPVGGLFPKRNVVFIVDATASMGYVEGAQTRFGAACAEVSHGLSELSSSDAANIIWMRATPAPVFPGLSSNLRYLQDATRRETVTMETGSVLPALNLALQMLDGTEGTKEIRVISDFQRSTWSGIEWQIPKDVKLGKISVTHEDAPNTAITGLHCEPDAPLVGEDVTIYCEVKNFSPLRRRCSVYFSVGEVRQAQEILIDEWGTSVAACKFKAGRPGPTPVSAALDEDAFPADDKRWTILTVRDALRVGIYADASCPDKSLAATWRKALESLRWAHVENISSLRRDLPLDVLMLAGWNGDHLDAIRNLLASGKTVICSPSPTADSLAGVSAVSGVAIPEGDTLRWEEATDHSLRIGDPKSSILKLFSQGDYGDPGRGKFRARLHTEIGRGEARIMEFDDGVPALAKLGKSGSFYLWNLPLDKQWSDWAEHTEFVLLMGELLLNSRSHSPMIERVSEPGEPIHAQLDNDALLSEIELTNEAGQSLPVVAMPENNHAFASRDLLKPGLYTWKCRQLPVASSAVNFPAPESDLRSLDDSEISRNNVLTTMEGRLIKNTRDAVPIWPLLVGLTALLIATEGIVLLWKD